MYARIFSCAPSELDIATKIFKSKLAEDIKADLNPGRLPEVPSSIYYKSLASDTLVTVFTSASSAHTPSSIGDKLIDTNDRSTLRKILYHRNKNAVRFGHVQTGSLALFILLLMVMGIRAAALNQDKYGDDATKILIRSAGGVLLPYFILRFYQVMTAAVDSCHTRAVQMTTLTQPEIDQFCAAKANDQFKELVIAKGNFSRTEINREQLDQNIESCDFGTISRETAKALIYKKLGLPAPEQQAEANQDDAPNGPLLEL